MSSDHDQTTLDARLDARLDAWGAAAAPPPGPLPQTIRHAARRRRHIRRARVAAIAALSLIAAAIITPALTTPRSRPAPLHPFIAEHHQHRPATSCGPTLLALRACNADLDFDLDNLRLSPADAMAWAVRVPPLGQ